MRPSHCCVRSCRPSELSCHVCLVVATIRLQQYVTVQSSTDQICHTTSVMVEHSCRPFGLSCQVCRVLTTTQLQHQSSARQYRASHVDASVDCPVLSNVPIESYNTGEGGAAPCM